MKYRIKNPDIEKVVRGMFKTEDQFEKELHFKCVHELKDSFDYVCLVIYPEKSITDGGVSIHILKSDIEEVPEYNPNGWNKYPDVRPPRTDTYLVTTKNGDVCTYGYAKFYEEFPAVNDDVVAFRELPKPFQE